MGMSAASAGMLAGLGVFAALAGILILITLAMTPFLDKVARISEAGGNAGAVISDLAAGFSDLAVAMYEIGAASILSLGGFGKMMKVMDKAIVLSAYEAEKATAMKSTMELVSQMVADPEGAIASMKTVATTDWSSVFSQVQSGVTGFLDAFDFGGTDSVQITHTLENLALIATGTSASKINASLGSKIVTAIERIAGKDAKKEQVLVVKLNPGDIEKLLKDGHAKIHAYGG